MRKQRTSAPTRNQLGRLSSSAEQQIPQILRVQIPMNEAMLVRSLELARDHQCRIRPNRFLVRQRAPFHRLQQAETILRPFERRENAPFILKKCVFYIGRRRPRTLAWRARGTTASLLWTSALLENRSLRARQLRLPPFLRNRPRQLPRLLA
jgi:hypothetical protein